ncbi:hypothetical protein [Niallia sp. MER 6]|uniref:hypothetical protein n=1 Tax=Niallia sp. MER 6 TaxID=2939567 RepID=UPI00203F560C|nr:hypothetical protein [Niallia sp. MER 6]MCM3034092.1 hypothetical protein [Niallia sp. MER 6]
MNKRMEKEKKRLVKRLLHGATVIEGEVVLIQNFLFPEVPTSILEIIDKIVVDKEKERQKEKEKNEVVQST